MSTLDVIATAAQWTAVSALFVAVWYRRHSWSYRWEQGITLHLLLLGVGLTLAGHLFTPQAALPPYVHVNSLDTFVGDVVILLSFAVLTANMLTRVSDDDAEAQQLINQRVMPIVTLAPVLMFATITLSTATDTDDLLAATADFWLAAYWCVVCVAGGALSAMTLWALGIIAEDPKNRPGARIWQWCARFAIATCVTGVANAIIPLPLGWLVWVFALAGAVCSASAAALSWRRRMLPFRLLMKFTHTTRRELRGYHADMPRHTEGDTPEPAV